MQGALTVTDLAKSSGVEGPLMSYRLATPLTADG